MTDTFADGWTGPHTGDRGGHYWLKQGAEDTAENRVYDDPTGGGEGSADGTEGARANPDRVASILAGAAKIPFVRAMITTEGLGPKDAWGSDEDGLPAYQFTTSAGKRYSMTATPSEDPVMNMEIVFADKAGATGITGAGGASEVFTKVTTAIVAMIQKRKPPVITFTAKEPSRQRLYDRLTTAVTAIDKGYAAFSYQFGPQRVYVVAKREEVEAAKAGVVGGYQSTIKVLAHSEFAESWFAESGWEGFTEDDHAIAGADGKRATELLAVAQADGARVFADACASAVARLVASPNPLAGDVLFSDEELGEIAGALSRTIATADLMGRARIRKRALRAEATEGFAESGANDDPFHDFAEPVPSMEPTSALEYFRRLVPSLGASAARYGPKLDRHSFTLAVASDQVILDRVKSAILRQLQTGESATADVQQILDEAGVSAKNPQYSEAVVRTAVMTSYNEGAAAEIAEPEMQEAFPVWRYAAIRDGRERATHGERDGKYYPSSVQFSDVRGNDAADVINCRCTMIPISRFLARGIRVEERW